MQSWKKPTDDTIGKALASVRKGTDRRYFFSRLRNPMWLQPLIARGYYESPPKARRLPDGSVQTPFWPELEYLKNIARAVPDEVTQVVMGLPEIDNQRVYYGILEIALELPGEHSAKLKPKVIAGARMETGFLAHRYRELLVHWTTENEIPAALELAKTLIPFARDPESDDKRKRRRENPQDMMASLDPIPRIGAFEYEDLLNNGIKPLAHKAPYEVARILINATANVIYLRTHHDALDQGSDEDYSEIWCRRLVGPVSGYKASEETLVHTLTFACEQVFESALESVPAIDTALRKQRWKIFRRLRQHLYALHPTEQTKSWIRESILEHKDYCRWEHHYEFQRMIRCACEHFGAELLTEEERTSIFEAILNGPSETRYREWMGENFTKELFGQRQRYFQRKQFKPFASVLFGKYLRCFRDLEEKDNSPISDENYSPVGESKGGMVSRRSPRSIEDLQSLDDEELLTYINEWDAEHRDEDDWLVEVTIEALAETFQCIFRESILPDAERFRFWLDNRERVQRPIYVRAMIDGMQERIKGKNFDRLDESLSFCEWVLSHPDCAPATNDGYSDQSREHRHWSSSRRAVVDLIDACLEEEINVPISFRKQLAKLLELLCTQYDWWLDSGKKVSPDENDQYTEAISNTRSRALESLVRCGWWLRRNDQQADVSMITMILEKRFSQETEYPLTLPERALLGVNYGRMPGLNEAWAVEHRSDFFPRESLTEWREAFGSFLRFNRPNELMFGVLRDDFAYALQHLSVPEQPDHSDEDFLAFLGRHLFTYYLWGLYPLNGTESLLQRFYEQTGDTRQRWRDLLRHVGFLLRNTGKNLEESLKDRITAFFEWRLGVGEAAEFGDVHFWLVSEGLGAEWRLDAYSRILNLCQDHDLTMMSMETDALTEMLPDHTEKVVECFAKLTSRLKEDTFYIRTETAKRILSAGLESADQGVRENAERARDDLLRRSRFDLLDLS